MNIPEAIIAYRARHNLSMADFAKLAGLSSQTVMYVERGLQTPSRRTEAKIINLLKAEEKGEQANVL